MTEKNKKKRERNRQTGRKRSEKDSEKREIFQGKDKEKGRKNEGE